MPCPTRALEPALDPLLDTSCVSAIVAMAWQDNTPFEAIALQFEVSESQVIALMREHLKPRSFKVWRMRVRGRTAKHSALQQAKQRSFHTHACTQTSVAGPVLSHPGDIEDLPLPPANITRQSLR
jgi:uncharacterized protein (TIGR03643 family)